jgi:hypothetical protein
VIELKHVGLAFGVFQSILGIGSAIGPAITGIMIDLTDGYPMVI